MDARIGMLMREGKTVHYAFASGYDKPAFEGSLEAVERALGLRKAFNQPKPRRAKVRAFKVTVTPKFTVYTGSHVEREHELDVDAASPADAIKQARQARRGEDGRFALPATFRVRLARTH